MSAYEESSFLIVGLARNSGRRLREEIQSISLAFGAAKSLHYLIVESDSNDNTREILERLSEERKNFCYASLGKLRDSYPKRTGRIAYCRNYYLKIIRENSVYFDVDYVVVADLDGVNSRLNAIAVETCWSRDDWDVCTANQLGPYYDIWALRDRLWSPNDCWQQAQFLRSMGLSQFKSVVASVHSRMVRIPPSSEWIEVDSAFGGLAVYKKEVILSVNYVGLNEQSEEVCEHVSAHEQIRSAGGRIFINPALINAGVVDHARYATWFGGVVFWFRCQVRELVRFVQPIKKVRSIFNNLST